MVGKNTEKKFFPYKPFILLIFLCNWHWKISMTQINWTKTTILFNKFKSHFKCIHFKMMRSNNFIQLSQIQNHSLCQNIWKGKINWLGFISLSNSRLLYNIQNKFVTCNFPPISYNFFSLPAQNLSLSWFLQFLPTSTFSDNLGGLWSFLN